MENVIKNSTPKFRNVENAKSYLTHCLKVRNIVNCGNFYYIVTPAQAGYLVNMGYILC